MAQHLGYAKDPSTCRTANGPTPAYEVARLRVYELAERIFPYVLGHTRFVLTVGYRCMVVGYAFIWTSGGDLFVTPNGTNIDLVVTGFFPYFDPRGTALSTLWPSGKCMLYARCCSVAVEQVGKS